MGIMDFVKGGVREMMVARADEQKQLIVYKHPNENLPTQTQLTVDPDECAVFYRSGNPPLVVALPPGRHSLSTQNIPFLNNFVTSFTGGNIFQAEVYFVTTRPIFNIPFGGALGQILDPASKLSLRPRLYGRYKLQVVNPVQFILGYTGQSSQGNNEAVTSWISQKLFLGIGKVLGTFFKTGQASYYDLGSSSPDIAAAIVRDCPDMTEIGIRVLEIGELKISLNEKDQELIDKLSAKRADAFVDAQIANEEGVLQARGLAAQKQFELDQRFANDARYVQQLAGNYQNYAVGQAMIGAGQGMADGGGGGVPQMAVGMGMMGYLQHSVAQQPVGPQFAAPQGAPMAAAPTTSGGAVQCTKCSAQVPPGKFCQECGSALAVAAPKKFCTSCGTEVGQAKFCSGCGTPASPGA